MVINNKKTREILGKTYMHVDFHTPSYQRGVGDSFNGDRFGKLLADANIDSIAFFAKDCHGMAYYDTKIGYKHPHCNRDLLKEAIEGCHKNGVKVLAYLSLAIDTEAGNNYPEWLQVDINGNKKGLYEDNAVSWVCLNSAYTEQMLIPMVKEIMENYNIDGFFFDELFYYENSCLCDNCLRYMEILDLNPQKQEDLSYFRAKTCDIFAQRVSKVINDYDNDLVIVYNPTTNIIGIMETLAPFEHSINVGGHETGWGYLNMPMEARYVRNFDQPILGLTGIFHRRWGDFGTVKNEAQLSYEIAEMMSHHFIIGIGDHLRPDGILEQEKLDLIGRINSRIKKLNLPIDAKPIHDVAIITPGTYDSAMLREGRSDAESFEWPEANGLSGASKALLDLHYQYDVLTEKKAMGNLEEYSLIILPETGKLLPEMVQQIQQYVAEGGTVLATGNTSLSKGIFELEDVFGVSFLSESPYDDISSVYMDLRNNFDNGIPKGIAMKVYSGYMQVLPSKKAQIMAGYYAPTVCNRHYTAIYKGGPANVELDSPAIVYNKFGKGSCIYVANDLFTAYYNYGYYGHRELIHNLIDYLHPNRKLDCEGSANLRVNLMRKDTDVYLHVIHYYPEDAGKTIPRINCFPPLVDANIYVRFNNCVEVKSLTGVNVDAKIENDKVTLKLFGIGQHEVIKLLGSTV